MQEFSKMFNKMVHYGFLGVYRRLSQAEEEIEDRFVPALTKACGIGAFLNFKYHLEIEEKRILPETERQIFQMFEFPLEEIIKKLPLELQELIKMETNLWGIGAMIESEDIDGSSVILTEDGHEMRANRAIHEAMDCLNQMGEYDSQMIYEEICKGDYVSKRLFLEEMDNVYIPNNRLNQNEEQKKFMRLYPDLFSMCYQKNKHPSLYRCKHCGMILREYRQGEFSCVSKKCNKFLDEKQKIEMYDSGWVMNDVVARSIYYPGRLEQEIKKILNKAKEIGFVDQYELWPGNRKGAYDTWDFKVYLKDGRVWVLDAKDVENAHWIIIDKREFLENAEFLYIVPNDRKRAYLDQINFNSQCYNKIKCMRLRELGKILGVK